MGNVLDLAEVGVVQGFERLPVSRVALAASWSTSLVKTGKGNAHKKGFGSTHCDNPWYAYERCGHGNFRWKKIPCNKWACDGCSKRRLADELVPEVIQALRWARDIGQTLKFLTPTYKADDPGASPTPAGATRRRLDFQHLVQYVRRDRDETFEYLRVAESHKSGKIHLHVLAVMPFIQQKALSDKWQQLARKSFRIDVRGAGMKCPRCYPDKKAPPAVKRRSIIIPPPGRGECLSCGYEPDWKLDATWADVAQAIAFEMGKYLTKEATTGGVKKKLNRSKAWAANCQTKIEKSPRSKCEECGEVHIVYWDGQEGYILARPGGELIWWSVEENVAWYLDKPGREPCSCFGDDVVWRAFGQEEPPRPLPEPPAEPPGRQLPMEVAR